VWENPYLREAMVPAIFVVLAIIEFEYAGVPGLFVFSEVATRFSRDAIMALALVIPVVAGLGLNFAVVIGAIGGQIGLIIANDLGLHGLSGIGFAALVGVGLGMLTGRLIAWCLQRAPGREMIVGIVLGFLADGIYRLVLMVGYGTIWPAGSEEMVLSRGMGLRDTIDFVAFRNVLDRLIPVKIGLGYFPLATIVFVLIVAALVLALLKSRTGQQFKAVGLDPRSAMLAGLDPVAIKRRAIMLSTSLAALSQVIYVQSVGMMNTYTAHRSVGFLAGAALLAGGATVKRASVRNALIGIAVFHWMFLLSPLAGQAITGSPAIGEYFRSFVTYGTICIALVVTGWARRRPGSAAHHDQHI
jgi:simple sugar transport system permease protein